MKPKNIVLAVIALAAFAAVAFAMFRPAGGTGIENVDAAGARAAIAAGAQVIDVRTAGEFQMGHIAGATNVPVDQVAAQAPAWDKSKTYLVYCATGARSATAVATMQSLGFGNIRHFNAGIQAWDGELESGSASSTKKIETDGKPVMVEFYTDT